MKEIELSLHNIKLLLREKVAQLNDQVSPKSSDPSEQDSTIWLVKKHSVESFAKLVDDTVFPLGNMTLYYQWICQSLRHIISLTPPDSQEWQSRRDDQRPVC